MRPLLTTALAVLLVAAPAAAQEPADPEPIPDFWTAEEEAIARDQAPAAPAAPAPAPPSPASTTPAPAEGPAAAAPACAEPEVLRRALDALQVAALRPLPARRGRRLTAVTVRSCVARHLRAEIRARDDDALLARTDAALTTGGTTRLRLTTTRAIERRAGRVRLILRVRLS
jgi:hypothetical protein